MGNLIPGIVVFFIFSTAVTIIMVRTLLDARKRGLTGRPLLNKLFPYIAIDTAFVAVFAVWLLRTL